MKNKGNIVASLFIAGVANVIMLEIPIFRNMGKDGLTLFFIIALVINELFKQFD